MENIPALYGSMVFDERVMARRLPAETYEAYRRSVAKHTPLEPEAAAAVANAMKDWAVEKGATHYTHWFQPMTGVTAEKHDSFVTPTLDGGAIMEFSGKELIKGEPDASAFPSGGLRATFEARGYTAWDPTSHAFVKENVLYIPSVFYSYGGEVLDKKTPLLRSLEVINTQALRILRLFGNTTAKRVITTVGAEQEYFLIDKEMYRKRKDLRYTGRTLFGAKPPKGQELETHYFGSIRRRVKDFMAELDLELWKLGIPAKTEHNEAAPAQHELAPIYTDSNQATEHNQLTMDLMQKVADRHGLVCLLHEKPFAGLNGSGKHNNWSLATDTGLNLFDPGKTPFENAQFLLFLCAVIKAVDEYQDLLRIAVASPGNDRRLGVHEAPPAIVSIFLGTELTGILEAIEKGENYVGKSESVMELGVDVLPHIRKDNTDRNRTSPFAFTGDKFEFRMPGASLSVAGPNFILNTIVADVLERFADRLEVATDFKAAINETVAETVRNHKRILFDGNGYDKAWVKEAERRGLLNLPTTPEALPYFINEKNIRLFTKHKVLTESEMRSRCGLLLEHYGKVLGIEAGTMIEMINKDIVPASYTYLKRLSETSQSIRDLRPGLALDGLGELVEKLCKLTESLQRKSADLARALEAARAEEADAQKAALAYCNLVIPAMEAARADADALEASIGEKYWPYPTYGDLLFYC